MVTLFGGLRVLLSQKGRPPNECAVALVGMQSRARRLGAATLMRRCMDLGLSGAAHIALSAQSCQ